MSSRPARPTQGLIALLVPLFLAGCLTINNQPAEGPSPAAGASGGPEAAGAQQAEEQEDGPFEEWSEVLEDTREIEGYFTLHRKRDNTLYLELPPARLGEDFGLLMHYSQGIGGMFTQEGLPASSTQMLRFRRSGDRIYLVRRNPRFVADSGSAMQTSLEDNVGHSVVGAFDIQSRHDSTGHLLLDVTDFVVSDYSGTGERLGSYYQGGGPRLDPDRSHLGTVRGFPRNVEVDAQLTYEASEPPTFGGTAISDYRSIPVGVRYSFFALPDDPMQPRLADLRVGHFLTTVQDFSNDESTDPFRRYVNRWRLEKANPSQELSEPVEPIVYYVDRSVPERYREYVIAGIEAWNEAFRQAGYRGAVEARVAPEDSSWSAEDVRYSTVRWTAAHGMGYAIGPSQVDPRTGEILNADVLIAANWIRFWLQDYQNLVAGRSWLDASVRDLVTPDPVSTENVGPGAGWRRQLRAAARGDAAGLPGRLCFAGAFRARQMAIQYAVLAARGEVAPGEKMPEEYVGAAIRDLVMHEVGHTLGLRHNFKATTGIPYDRLHDERYTREHGVSLSVMDYVPVNIAGEEEDQGHYFNQSVGTYDEWVIEYAYAPVYGGGDGGTALSPAGATVERASAERPALKRIARRSSDSLHTYGTDEDAGLGVDPRANAYDLGSDPLRYARDRSRLIGRLLPELDDRLIGEGDSWHRLREGFDALLFSRFSAAMPAAKVVGGLYTSRDYRGEPNARPPFRPVPADRQREALDLLVEQVLAEDAFEFEPEQLNRLAPNMWSDWSRDPGELSPMAYPVHERVSAMQSSLISTLLSPDRLARVRDNRLRSTGAAGALGMAEIFGRLTGAVWSEIEDPSSAPEISSFRRNLQRSHLQQLQTLLLNDEIETLGGAVSVPEDARSLARHEMREILSRVEGALASDASLGEIERAHLRETRARLERALKASVTLPTDDG